MIVHVVVFRWSAGVTQGQVERLSAALGAVADGIPELTGYACGPDLGLRPGGEDFGVVAMARDEAGLSAYLDSAAHAEVYERHLRHMVAERRAAQIGATLDFNR